MNRVLPAAIGYECKNIWSGTSADDAMISLEALFHKCLPVNMTGDPLPPIPGLIPEGRNVRDRVMQIAAACHISPILLTRLHHRQIVADTVPVALLESLAAELQCTAGQVFAYLQQEEAVRSSTMYMRRGTRCQPVERLEFEQALTSTPDLPYEVRQAWMELCC